MSQNQNTTNLNAGAGLHCELTQVVLAVGLGLISANALAQQPLPQETTLPTVKVQDTADTVLNPKASTQGKFTAPLIDTPKTVNVIPQEVIQQTGSTTLTDALRLSPGITMGSGEGGNPSGDRPFIRGNDSQSSIYVDGVRDIAAGSREMFNIETVEVIKGADSAYGGRGGAGGSINMATKAPGKENFFNADLSAGNANYKRGTIDINRVLNDTTAIRLNAMAHDADIPGREGPTNKRWGIATSITFGLGTPDQLTLSYQHLDIDNIPDGGVPYYYNKTTVPASTSDLTLRPDNGGNRNN